MRSTVDETLTERIEDALAKPASATIDNQSATAHSIPDQIQGAQFIETRRAMAGTNDQGGRRSGWGGIAIARAVPPGASGDC